MYEKKFMMEAIALSQRFLEDGKGGPFGAVVVKFPTATEGSQLKPSPSASIAIHPAGIVLSSKLSCKREICAFAAKTAKHNTKIAKIFFITN